MSDLTARTLAAATDAFQEQGRLRRPTGGDAADLPGARLWASGLPARPLNGVAVEDPSAVDVAAIEAWFAPRGVPWGFAVPSGVPWPHGRHLLTRRLMALERPDLPAGPDLPGVAVRSAGPDDLDDVLRVDEAAFGADDPDVQRRWVEPHLRSFSVTTVVASLDGSVVGTAYGVRSDGRAGPAYLIGGVGVVPEARGRGIAAAMSAWLIGRGRETGAELVHLSPDSVAATRVYARLGFVDAGAREIYVPDGT